MADQNLKVTPVVFTAPSLSMNEQPKAPVHCTTCGAHDELAMHRCKHVEHSNEWSHRAALHRECNWVS